MKSVNYITVGVVLFVSGCSMQPGNVELSVQDESNTITLVVNRADYQQRLYGFWLGQNIANWTGLITEMDKIGTHETMPFYTDDDWGKLDLPAFWGEGVPHSDRIGFYVEQLDSVWGADDDTDIEYMYLHLMNKHNHAKLTAKQIQQGWLTHTYSETDAPLYQKFPGSKPVQENFLWVSNERARILMAQGLVPPQTSEPKNNDKFMMIDAQLTTELFGLIAPGRPDIALELAELPIRVSAKGDTEWISKFYVVMHSLATRVDKDLPLFKQTQWLAHQARQYLPQSSVPAKMFDFVWLHYSKNSDKTDWESTRDAVYQRYQIEQQDGYQYLEPFDGGINFAASLVSLFYGNGDLKETIRIGSLTGWDSDNPTATWGGLIGFLIGKDGVEKAFSEYQLSNVYWIHRTRRNFPDLLPGQKGEDTLSNIANRATNVVDGVINKIYEGRYDNKGDNWIFTIK